MNNISLQQTSSSLCLCFSPLAQRIPKSDTSENGMTKKGEKRLNGARKINVTLKQNSKNQNSYLNELEMKNKKFSVIIEGVCVSQAIKMAYDRPSNKLKTKMKEQSFESQLSTQKQEISNQTSFINQKKNEVLNSDYENQNLSKSLKYQFWQILFGDSQKFRKTLSTENEQLYHSQHIIKKQMTKNEYQEHSFQINKSKNFSVSYSRQNIQQTFLNVPKLDIGSMTFSKSGDISFMSNKEQNFDLLQTEMRRLLSQ